MQNSNANSDLKGTSNLKAFKIWELLLIGSFLIPFSIPLSPATTPGYKTYYILRSTLDTTIIEQAALSDESLSSKNLSMAWTTTLTTICPQL